MMSSSSEGVFSRTDSREILGEDRPTLAVLSNASVAPIGDMGGIPVEASQPSFPATHSRETDSAHSPLATPSTLAGGTISQMFPVITQGNSVENLQSQKVIKNNLKKIVIC